MKLAIPETSLIGWTVVSLVAVLLMLAALGHLCLNKDVKGNNAVRWLIAIVLVPVFGPLLYFRSLREIKRLQ